MKIFEMITRLFQRRSTLSQPESWLIDALGGKPVASGVRVNEETALTYTAVYTCVRVLAETMASLPLILYERMERGKRRADSHPLYKLLHDQPNPEMTSFEFRETLMGHLCLWGNAYAEIVSGKDGHTKELWPLRPDRMIIERLDTGHLLYYYTMPNGEQVTLPPEKVLHIRGLSGDGVVGYSPIRLAREAVGLGLATEEFGARFFGEGTHLGGIVEHPGQLSGTAHENLRQSLAERYSGLGKSHRVLILEEGMKWTQIGIPPEDAQFLQTRKFQVNEIARIYRVPPHMVGDLERATFSNVEQQAIDFVVHTIRPWLVRWEQAINTKLLSELERRQYFAEFLVEGLLRGDTESRYRAYAVGRQWGWLSANDVRELENMNPVIGGDTYLVPLNMAPAGSEGQEAASIERRSEARAKQQKPGVARAKLAVSFRPVFEDAARRIVSGEVKDIKKAIRQHLQERSKGEFEKWLDEYYMNAQERIARTIRPAVQALTEVVQVEAAKEIGAEPPGMAEMEQHVKGYSEVFAEQHARLSKAKIQKRLEGDNPEEALLAEIEEWEEQRPGKIAMKETVEANNVMTKLVLGALGVTALRWVAVGADPCPYCQAMDGKVVPITGVFGLPGSTIQPEGQDPLVTSSNIKHPPLHQGCECTITAG